MTIRDHLIDSHKTHAEFHRGMAKIHRDHIGKADGFGDSFHKTAAEHHDSFAARHDAHCEACKKAAGATSFVKRSDMIWPELDALVKLRIEEAMNELTPPAISKVAPDAPGVTLVQRPGHGNPPLPGDKKPMVPLEFAKLVAIEED